MEAKDIEKHKKELLQIGRMINNFLAEYALCAYIKERAKPDICKVAEDIFEISFRAEEEQGRKAGIREVVDYLISDDNGLTITIYGDKWGAKLKEWGIE